MTPRPSARTKRLDATDSIFGHADTPVSDIRDAMRDHNIQPDDRTAECLAENTQAILQGGYIGARTSNDPTRAVQAVQRLKRLSDFSFSEPDRGHT